MEFHSFFRVEQVSYHVARFIYLEEYTNPHSLCLSIEAQSHRILLPGYHSPTLAIVGNLLTH